MSYFCPKGCYRVHTGLIPGSHRALTVRSTLTHRLIPATYRPLTGLLTFNRSLNDLITSCYRSAVLITSPYRPVAVCFTLRPFRNREKSLRPQFFYFCYIFPPCPQRFHTVSIPGPYRLQRPGTSQCHRVGRSLAGSRRVLTGWLPAPYRPERPHTVR